MSIGASSPGHSIGGLQRSATGTPRAGRAQQVAGKADTVTDDTWDADGNLAKEGDTSYDHDALNRLRHIDAQGHRRLTVTYDAEGRRKNIREA